MQLLSNYNGGSRPGPHTLVLPVPVRWQPVPSDPPIAVHVAKFVPDPSPHAVAARIRNMSSGQTPDIGIFNKINAADSVILSKVRSYCTSKEPAKFNG